MRTPDISVSGATSAEATTLPGPELQAVLTPEVEGSLWAVVLAGGIGSRFWPLSSPERPKQLLTLIGERPLITETIGRLYPLVPPDRVLVLTSRDIGEAIHAAVPDIPLENMIVEPRPAGTASALAIAAREIERRAGPETIFCSVHADLAIAFPEAFRNAVRQASRIASVDDVLVAIGVPASRPETAFGYIVPGEPLTADVPLVRGGACAVATYVEKPGLERAQALLADGALWNSGIFVWRTRVVLDALRRYTREIDVDAPGRGNGSRYAGASPARTISLERGLLERCDRLVVLPGEFGWDDVGTWASLRRARELDDDGNGAYGPVHFVDATANVVHSEGTTVVMFGVSGLLVVSLPGLTFVTPLDRAADLRPLLAALPEHLRSGGGSGGTGDASAGWSPGRP